MRSEARWQVHMTKTLIQGQEGRRKKPQVTFSSGRWALLTDGICERLGVDARTRETEERAVCGGHTGRA